MGIIFGASCCLGWLMNQSLIHNPENNTRNVIGALIFMFIITMPFTASFAYNLYKLSNQKWSNQSLKGRM
jgi:predicted membrane channel-forming protein YqfA (hemolysin III family)